MIKRLLMGLGVIGCFLFLLPFCLYGTFNIGNITGCIVSLLCLLAGFKLETIKAYRKTLIYKFVMGLICLILGIAIIETVLIVHGSVSDANPKGTMIVLGCLVKKDRPSLSLKQRLKTATAYLKAHPQMHCIVSGGQGSQEAISEAECMYTYLVEHGIEASRIEKEDQSTTTIENLTFSKRIIEAKGKSTDIVIVTNHFHLFRAKYIARKMGFQVSGLAAPTSLTLLPTHFVRELYALLYVYLQYSF